MNATRCGVLLGVGLLLAGCMTTELQPPPGSRPDMKEAARLNTQLGIDYMRKGQFEAALEKLKRALDQDPNLAMAHSTIALVYQRKGDIQEAEEHYREALDLNSNDPGTLNNFGVFLCGQNKVEDAEEIFLKAAKNRENPQPADAWANAGVCVKNDKKLADRAEGYFREALTIDARHPNALAQMAQVSYDKKDYLRARAFLQRYESVAQVTAQTLYLGALTERKLGDKQAARTYERRLRTQFPDAHEGYDLEKAGR
jgi:type IV pilus assembly protein PilF